MAQLEADELAQAVIDRMADCPSPRFRQLMTSMVAHAHAFAREVELTPDEWMAGIQFLTAIGQKCDDKRQEFILLSDTLGLSMLVVAMEQARGPPKPRCKGLSIGTTRLNSNWAPTCKAPRPANRPTTLCPTTARWAACCAAWCATRTGPAIST